VDRRVGCLALPCLIARTPLPALPLHRFARRGRGYLLEENLYPVGVVVGDDLDAGGLGDLLDAGFPAGYSGQCDRAELPNAVAVGKDRLRHFCLYVADVLQGPADQLAFAIGGKPLDAPGYAGHESRTGVGQAAFVDAFDDGDVVQQDAFELSPLVGRDLRARAGVEDGAGGGGFRFRLPCEQFRPPAVNPVEALAVAGGREIRRADDEGRGRARLRRPYRVLVMAIVILEALDLCRDEGLLLRRPGEAAQFFLQRRDRLDIKADVGIGALFGKVAQCVVAANGKLAVEIPRHCIPLFVLAVLVIDGKGRPVTAAPGFSACQRKAGFVTSCCAVTGRRASARAFSSLGPPPPPPSESLSPGKSIFMRGVIATNSGGRARAAPRNHCQA
jgi:hypothetical protein